jgi:3-oxoacyl-[acyl-carrier protein] reductase
MRAFVTGASGGIGAATARRLASQGWELALHGHTHQLELEKLAQGLAREGRRPFVLLGDLADPSVPAELAKAVAARWEALDLLVLNAGAYDRARFEEIRPNDLERTVRVNFTSSFDLVQRLLPLLRRSERGRIVFVTSVLAFTGSTHGAHYAAAKAALLGLARSLARELAPAITVNVVAPGSIDTAILAGDTPEVRAARGRTIPLGRVGDADEVAGVIAFLASPDASYITGTTVHVNGGVWMG